jgi:hypothetical protein
VFIWSAGQFRLDHTFDTQQATDITFLPMGPYLVVAEMSGLSVLTRSTNGDFANNITVPLGAPVRVERGSGAANSVIVVANRENSAQVLQFIEGTVAPMEISVNHPHYTPTG